MRIKQISVTDLFGIFNHTIPLNMEERITIIHGPNGFGKTVILRMINGLFNSQYEQFRTVPFSIFRVDFDDYSYLEVTKKSEAKNTDDGFQISPLIFDFYQQSTRVNSFTLEEDERENYPGERENKISGSKEEILQHLEKIFSEIELRKETDKVEKTTEWLKNLTTSIKVRIIESQRLLTKTSKKLSRLRIYAREDKDVETVLQYADELAEKIQLKQAEYGTMSQSLDREFPTKLMKRKSSHNLTEEQIRNQIDRIEKQRNRFINAGLLDKSEAATIPVEEEEIEEATRIFLSAYLEDVEQKLSVFEEFAEKIELFNRIISKRFSFSGKQIHISKEKGFTITTPDGNVLSPKDLSSGEQHELVIIYELLFKVEPNSLILIDEPELSLHVEWLVNFLKDLQAITAVTDIDILMATHSPSLIHGRWDLTVALKKGEKPENVELS